MVCYDGLQEINMYCQNCGHRITGYRSRDRTMKTVCGRCGAKTVSRKISRRTVDTRMTAPKGQALLE